MSKKSIFIEENLKALEAYEDRFTHTELKHEIDVLKKCIGRTKKEMVKNVSLDKDLMISYIKIRKFENTLDDKYGGCVAALSGLRALL